MNLHRLLQQRAAAGRPVRVALIGAGKFGSMFLSQVRTTPGLEGATIADVEPERARATGFGVPDHRRPRSGAAPPPLPQGRMGGRPDRAHSLRRIRRRSLWTG